VLKTVEATSHSWFDKLTTNGDYKLTTNGDYKLTTNGNRMKIKPFALSLSKGVWFDKLTTNGDYKLTTNR
jgi:hypothetical protein